MDFTRSSYQIKALQIDSKEIYRWYEIFRHNERHPHTFSQAIKALSGYYSIPEDIIAERLEIAEKEIHPER